MIKEIFNQTNGQLLKLALISVSMLGLLFHILPKSKNKEETVGFFGEILKFIKGIFKK
tara:strand:- start:223 stop:396 length:174 start_codon:yes stop_codon:yes gene_type:complete